MTEGRCFVGLEQTENLRRVRVGRRDRMHMARVQVAERIVGKAREEATTVTLALKEQSLAAVFLDEGLDESSLVNRDLRRGFHQKHLTNSSSATGRAKTRVEEQRRLYRPACSLERVVRPGCACELHAVMGKVHVERHCPQQRHHEDGNTQPTWRFLHRQETLKSHP